MKQQCNGRWDRLANAGIRARQTLRDIISRIESPDSAEAKLLGTAADRKVYNIIHLIYRAKNYEGHSKDYEFSRLSMEEHWRAGYHDARRTLRHPEVLKRPPITRGY